MGFLWFFIIFDIKVEIVEFNICLFILVFVNLDFFFWEFVYFILVFSIFGIIFVFFLYFMFGCVFNIIFVSVVLLWGKFLMNISGDVF